MESVSQRQARLLDIVAKYQKVLIAFSGGVDSTLVAKAAQLACGERAIAVTAVSPSLSSQEESACRLIAEQIGIQHRFVKTEEMQNPDYVENSPRRCYFCKSELYHKLTPIQQEFGAEVIMNGANLDDQTDYRPGLQAAQEYEVVSPLVEAQLRKADVRELAQAWNLTIWDKPATPCLSSRIAYGLSVTPERLHRIDQAEQFLKEKLQIRELRVRHEPNDLARIEVPVEALPRLTEPELRATLVNYFDQLGFKYLTLDLAGFRSGSMNAFLPLEDLNSTHSS